MMIDGAVTVGCSRHRDGSLLTQAGTHWEATVHVTVGRPNLMMANLKSRANFKLKPEADSPDCHDKQ